MAAEIISGQIVDDACTFEPVPEWTAEEFANTSIPHAWVLEKGGGEEYRTMRYRDMVSAYAKTLGIRNFVSQFAAYAKLHRGSGTAAQSHATDFDGQPLELLCGAYTADDETGITTRNLYGEPVRVCGHPLMPSKRLYNVDTGEVQIEISYRRSGAWRSLTVPRSMLASAQQIVGLSAWGVGVDSENAKAMVKYFTEIEQLNYQTIPEISSTNRLGWVGGDDGGMFAPYVDGLQYDGDPAGRQLFDAVRSSGSAAVWLEYFAAAREKNTVVKLLLAASFASAMVKPCRSLPFILHLWGGTEAGKTVGLMSAISVWGTPSHDGGLFHNFNTTDVGVEVLAGTSNSVPVFLDELQIAKDRKSFDEFIYKFAEGVGRTRGAKAGGLAQMKRWTNTAITTGEMPISTSQSGGGALNRVIEIDCKGLRLFENPREACAVMSENYGFAGRAFVSMLSGNLALARNLQEQYLAELQKTDVTDKQALSASLLLAADHLASLWLFGEDTRLTVPDILPYLSTRDEVDVNRRALEWLRGWTAEHMNNFVGGGDTKNALIFGRVDGDRVAIIRKTFTEAMIGATFNPTAFLAWACTIPGLIEHQAKHYDKPVRIQSGAALVRCVVINFAAYGDYDENEVENLDDLPM